MRSIYPDGLRMIAHTIFFGLLLCSKIFSEDLVQKCTGREGERAEKKWGDERKKKKGIGKHFI